MYANVLFLKYDERMKDFGAHKCLSIDGFKLFSEVIFVLFIIYQ